MSPSTAAQTSRNPTSEQIELVGSLIASQPTSVEGYVTFGRSDPAGWDWTLAELGTTASVAAAVSQMQAPSDCEAIGLVSRATARRVDLPTAPAVPVIVAYAVTRHDGSVSVVAYPDGQAIWCTSPTGALAEAAASAFGS